jgi:hypothetical protein
MGIQLQLFASASKIFFDKVIVCTASLRQLLIIVGCNKKSFHNQIASEEFFVSKFLLSVD